MRTPLIEQIRQQLTAVVFLAKQDASKAQDLAAAALKLADEAIAQVQGAREDAYRMAGRVHVCTELYDMLAPDECSFLELLARHPRLDAAYGRFMRLDANGACSTATDIEDALVHGQLSAADAARFADEIEAACDALERGDE